MSQLLLASTSAYGAELTDGPIGIHISLQILYSRRPGPPDYHHSLPFLAAEISHEGWELCPWFLHPNIYMWILFSKPLA
jgi:hypothetical protein